MAYGNAQKQYDITLSRSTNANYGFNLATDEEGRKFYRRTKGEDMDTTRMKKWDLDQRWWHGGMGKYKADENYPMEYSESVGWDAREAGILKLFGVENSVTLDTDASAPDLTNGGFETWASGDASGWTESDCDTVEETTTVYGGSGSSCSIVSTEANANIHQTVSLAGDNNSTEYRWRIVTFAAYVNTADGAHLRLGIDHGTTDIHWGPYNTGHGSFEQIKCIVIIPGDVSSIVVYVQKDYDDDGGALLTYVDAATLSFGAVGSETAGGRLCVDGDDLYYAVGRRVYKWDTDQFELQFEVPGIIAPAEVYTDDNGSRADKTTEANNSTLADINMFADEPIAAQDYFWIGSSTKFQGVLIKGSTVSAWNDVTCQWQYYNGATWVEVPSFTSGSKDLSHALDAFPSAASNAQKLWYLLWDVSAMTDWTAESTPGATSYYHVRMAFTDTTDNDGTEPICSQIWLLDNNTSDSITDLVAHDGYLYIFCGNNHPIFYWDGTYVWPTHQGSDEWGEFATEHKGKVYANLDDTSLSHCAQLYNGTTTWGSFSTPDQLVEGPSNTAITCIESHGDVVWVGKTNNVYWNTVYTEGSADAYYSTVYNEYAYGLGTITERFNSMPDSDNFRRMKSIDSTMYLTHTKGMWVWEGYQNGTLTNISPFLKFPYQTDYLGEIKAVCAGQDYVYVGIDPSGSNTKGKIMAISYENIPGLGTDYRWHSLAQTDIDTIHDMIVFADYLWVCGTDNSVVTVKRYKLTGSDYPTATDYTTGTATFTLGSTTVSGAGTTWTAAMVGRVIKCNADGNWYTITARASDTSITINTAYTSATAAGAAYTISSGLKVEYEVDGSGSYTEVGGTGNGTFGVAGTKPFAANTSGKRIRLRLTHSSATFVTQWLDGGDALTNKVFGSVSLSGDTFNANGSTATPKVTGIRISCIEDAGSNNNMVKSWEVKINPEDHPQGSHKRVYDIIDDIDTLSNDAMITFYCVDKECAGHDVQIVPPTPEEQYVWSARDQGGKKDPIRVIALKMNEVP